MKWIQGKKKRDTEEADALADAAAEAAAANAAQDEAPGMDSRAENDGKENPDEGIGGGDAGGKDMLDQGKDEDVIF
jgi:V-type H+-transporting ATPase subunit D